MNRKFGIEPWQVFQLGYKPIAVGFVRCAGNIFIHCSRGIEIAKRIERLKENITRTYKAIDDTDRPNIKARNQVKLKAYEQELDELVKQVK